MVLSSWYNDDI